MTFRRGLDLSPSQFPRDVRGRLAELDRLQQVWAAHQRRRPDHQWADDRRRSVRRHVAELRASTGRAPRDAGRPDPADRDPADHDLAGASADQDLRREEDALVAMAADCRSGLAVTGEYLDRLAAALSPSGPPSGADLNSVAAAARVETHPLVRAAYLHLVCEDALRGDGPHPSGATPRHRPLPWAVASLSLMRSNYPPLIMDRRLARPYAEAMRIPDADARLTAVVRLFADLGTAALRGELSWTADADTLAPAGSRALATAIHRRVQRLLRECADSTVLVLRELDPAARAAVACGDSDDDKHAQERFDSAAERALFRRGPGCWWTGLDLTVSDAALRLLIAVQDVGRPATGVLAVTADAQLTTCDGVGDALDLAGTECATLIPTDSAGERWPDVQAFVEDAVSRALDQLMRAMR